MNESAYGSASPGRFSPFRFPPSGSEPCGGYPFFLANMVLYWICRSPGTAGKPGRRVQPIRSLNPYMGSWCIKARLVRKDGSLRNYNSKK